MYDNEVHRVHRLLLKSRYRLVLRTLPPVPLADGAATSFFGAAARFPAAEAVIAVALLTAFLTIPGFLTIVVCALESEFWLLWLAALPRPACFGGTGGGAIAPARPPLPRTLPACLLVVRDEAAGLEGFSEADTRLARDAVAAATVPDLMGDTGRASPDFPGEILTGDCGYVRELCDFGESTLDGSTLRDTAFAFAPAGPALVVVVLVRFLGRSRSSWMFSLSDWPIISVL